MTYREIVAVGDPYAIGRQIGEAARDLIAEGIAFYEEHHEAMTGLPFVQAEADCAGLVRAARMWLPTVLDELAGMAEGSGVPLSKLMVPNCGEELADRRGRGHCTSLAVSDGRRGLLAHNEDWFAGDLRTSVLLRLALSDGTKLIAVTPACLLPAGGMNSHGIASCGNTVYADDARVGVPNNFVRRWMLEARSVDEARARALLNARARGSNHLMVDSSARICDVETSATSAAVFDVRGWFAHTNHYLHQALRAREVADGLDGSRARYARARQLVVEGMRRGDDPFRVAESVLVDHENGACSICSHPDPQDPVGARECTTSSTIYDLTAMTASICVGPPCESARSEVSVA